MTKLSFYGNQDLYQGWGDQLKAHAGADELIQGQGWGNGKGFFIGCSIHEYSHRVFAEKFNLPIEIGQIADSIFEGLDKAVAKSFAIEIFEAIKVGVDYSKFYHQWSHWLICDPEHGVIRFSSDPRVAAVGLLHLEAQTSTVSVDRWDAAADEARAAARAAARAWDADAARDAQRSKFLKLLGNPDA